MSETEINVAIKNFKYCDHCNCQMERKMSKWRIF